MANETAKVAIDKLLKYENILLGDKNEEQDIMMNREFTNFLANLEISGFTSNGYTQHEGFELPSTEASELKSFLQEADYETLQKLTLKILRTERFAPGLINGLYAEGFFDSFFSRIKEIKEQL